MRKAAPRLTIPVLESAIRRAVARHHAPAPESERRKHRDFTLWDGQERGLHILDRNGTYAWRLKYTRPDGRDNRLALGIYPDVSLAEARAKAAEAHALLGRGIDPGAAKKATKAEAKRTTTATFERFARQWVELKSPGWAESTRRKAWLVVDSYLIPALGKRDVRDVSSADVLRVIRKMNSHAPALARKASRAAQAIIRHAIAEGAREDGRLLDLNLADNLPKQDKGHYSAATTPADVKAVMDKVRGIGSEVTRAALLAVAYTAQRPGNVAAMRWCDVDTKASEWNIPAEFMKTGQPHTVPLSRQALVLIESMRAFTAGREYVFPPLARQATPHLHRDSLSKALREAGLQGKQTPHGLRATLRTVARERLGISADVLEAQLAHAKQGEVQSAYDRTGFVEERHRVMQTWADYLDGTSRDTVTPIHRKVR